ncbi:hypothetical protein BKA65DRAFT_547744 [Rhexocercosporidium sp. MPI-PUGE-AT-0058]|nr:hypothetical protein BKA65DRAFT_547744 [Rhexocercosporidium sp. MPI-PUGE-AT-0058]
MQVSNPYLCYLSDLSHLSHLSRIPLLPSAPPPPALPALPCLFLVSLFTAPLSPIILTSSTPLIQPNSNPSNAVSPSIQSAARHLAGFAPRSTVQQFVLPTASLRAAWGNSGQTLLLPRSRAAETDARDAHPQNLRDFFVRRLFSESCGETGGECREAPVVEFVEDGGAGRSA